MGKSTTTFLSVLRVLLAVLAVVALILALIALVSPLVATAAIPGVVVGAVGMFNFGRYPPTMLMLLVLAAITWVAFLINPHVWASALVMAAVGLAVGLAGRYRLRSVSLVVAIFSASALFPSEPPVGELWVDPPPLGPICSA